MSNNIHFSSNSNECETPQELFDKLNMSHNFDLDVCATPFNAKCKRYFTKKENGLSQPWHKHGGNCCWMNPPYGRQISKWMKKAYEESLKGAKVVCLVPARTDTRWWHDYAMKGNIEFLKGRLKFVGANSNTPFPSAIIIFGDHND